MRFMSGLEAMKEEFDLVSDRRTLFEALNLSNESISKYKNIKFSEEDKVKLEEIQNSFSFEYEFDYTTLKSIYDSEPFLSNSIMTTFILYLVEKSKESFLGLFRKGISSDLYINTEFRMTILLSMEQVERLELTSEDVQSYCNTIFTEENDITFYKKFSRFINDKLFESITNIFSLEPKREMNYLVIFACQDRGKLEELVEKIQGQNFEEMLLLTQACYEISKISKEFPTRMVKMKLRSKIDYQWEEIGLLLNHYSNLLFTLIIDSDDEVLADEIRGISETINQLQLRNIVYLVYGTKRKISHSCAECLYLIISKASDDEIEELKYPISHIYSLLEESLFIVFYIPIISIIGIHESDPILTRILNNPESVILQLVKMILDMDEHFDRAIKIIKLLYKKGKISISTIEEKFFLRFLRINHSFELDADFICNIAIELFLNTSNQVIKRELYEYILSSIYDNYYYFLQEKVAIVRNEEPELEELNSELVLRNKLHEKSRINSDFKPSEKNMNTYYEKKAERDRKIMEEADKQSALLNLFSKQTILYGHKIQYKQIDEEGNLHTKISEMKKMNHSVPIPARFINDPVFLSVERAVVLEDKLYD